MKKSVLGLVSSAAFFAISTPAVAQVSSGPRVEAMVGFDNVRLDLSDAGLDDSISRSGVVFGVGVGFDVALGTQVALGVDLEATEATTEFDESDGTNRAELKAGRDLYAGMRLSVPMSRGDVSIGNFFVKGGYTNLRVEGSASSGGSSMSASDELDGARAGVGFQFLVGPRSYISAEYRYSNYEADVTRNQVLASFGLRF